MASNDDKCKLIIWHLMMINVIIWHDDKCKLASNDDKCKLIIWHLMMINVN